MDSRQLDLPAKAKLWAKSASGMTTHITDSQQTLERIAFDLNRHAVQSNRDPLCDPNRSGKSARSPSTSSAVMAASAASPFAAVAQVGSPRAPVAL
jgi:hypothetical protein